MVATNAEPMMAMMAHIFIAVAWLRYLGIKVAPQMYPTIIPMEGINP